MLSTSRYIFRVWRMGSAGKDPAARDVLVWTAMTGLGGFSNWAGDLP